MKKNIKWIVIICVITTSVLYAQNLNIRRFSIEDGLIQSQVRAIIQDKEGLIWFGTGEGISRFDGREFINYNRKDGLASNFIESAFCDHNDKLWFGHFNGSITKFDKTTQCFERIVVYPHTARTSKAPVYRIIEDYNLDKWFVTYGLGLFHITDDSVVNITSKNGLLCEKLNDIIQLPDSSYWISSDKGVNILYYNQKHNNYVCDTLKSDPFWPDTPVQTLFLDSKQNIWAEASNGLYKISEKMDGENYLVEFYDKSVGFNSDDIRDIIEDHAGNLWISTGDHGIFRLSNKENKSDLANFRHFTAQNGIGSDFLNTVYEDNENNIWIGTDGSGAARLRDLGIEVYDKTDGLINECIWTILQEDINTVWVGHDLGMSRLSFFGNDDGKYEVKNYLYFNNEKINHVLDISQDNKNNIWFFSLTHQPIVLDHKNKKMKIMDLEKKYGYKNAITMAADNEGNLWFGSRTNGILKVNPALTEGKLFTEENGEITSSIINTIYKDREGQLWFGTENGGVLRFDGRQFHPYSTETGYAIISAVSIAEDKSGKMWFVSSEDQLFCLNGTAMTLMKGLKGLDGKTIYSVTAADDFLWIGTTNGLCKISLANLKTTHYGMRGGYPIFETNENASLIDKEGNLWFGTIRGVVKIMPTLLKSIPEAPTPVISKIQVFLQDMKLPENNKFEYNQNHLTFHFRSISLTAPEQVRYKYILKGFDDNWSPEIAVDYATYSNLNPGNYVFEVIAGNGRGEWNSIPARFAFEIKTPFWQTWWFYFVPLFLIGFLIFIFVLQRIKSMQNAKMILEKRVRLRTMELHEEKTKFEEANRALSAEKERLIVTLRSIGEGVITTDEDGKITMINSTAEMICEVKSEEVIGKPLCDVFPITNKKNRENVLNIVERIKKSGELFSSPYNNNLVTKSGVSKNISYSGSPIRDRESKIMGVVIVFRDITDQLKMEKELFKNQKLESLGVLAGGIAHDFNNLLTAITGNLSLSRFALNKNHKIYHRLELAEKASDRARDLIRQLLTFSKGGTPVKQTTSIRDLVKETTEFVLRGSKVKYEIDFPPDLYSVDVDPGQINQVIHNIILNANQAMPNGGIIKISAKNKKITSRSRVPLKPGNYIRLNIEDNGPGIPSSHKQKIFDPFFTTKTNGSGLGLASAFSIIKRHQGFITLDSDIGKGSVFKIYLPSTLKEVRKNEHPISFEMKGDGKILVMDDELFVRDTASDMLSFLGFNVVCVKDGSQMLKEYETAHKRNEPYDAVILDLTIPGGMGGEAALKKLRNFDPNVTAIVASGYSSDPIMANYSKYGFKARLIKPYNLQEVGKILQSTLRN